jgi:plastocyanin domain-containing protein
MKAIIISVSLVSVLLIGGAFIYAKNRSSLPASNGNNVSVVGDKQIIDLTAKGGYSPLRSTAKAGVPTTLRVSTNGTFDCSSSFRIPSMDISRSLPATGVTEIDLGSPKLGVLKGVCGMGMYPFEIDFTS